ncbi:MAG: radical SAM family heme chaperone HemW [Phycisphaerae bacterium]|nr:radical SAM family heme chaperone HemW [Phycisphaerae bacterium]
MTAQTIPLSLAGSGSSAERWLNAIDEPVESLYLHVPFCFHKCHYCDFYSFVDTQDRQPAFTDALILEVRRLADFASRGRPEAGKPSLSTLFVGGGTPSLLRTNLWERLLGALHESFRFKPDAEFTVECNPETVTPDLIRALRAGGVNRVSIGAQSFEARHLKTLERWHDPANVQRALRLAAEGGIERRNIDLIFAVPGQSIDEWRGDLERALALDPGVEHLSCYALTYEPNTAMTQRLRLGQFTPMDDETESEMYRLTVSILRDRGYNRYEVSNFARPGAECRHNLAYWRHRQWLAAGPSASTHVAGARWKNIPRLSEWLESIAANRGISAVVDLETPDEGRALRERIMLGLRLSEGLESAPLLSRAAMHGADTRLLRVAQKYADTGAMTMSGERWALTDEGFLIADSIAAELMSAVRC